MFNPVSGQLTSANQPIQPVTQEISPLHKTNKTGGIGLPVAAAVTAATIAGACYLLGPSVAAYFSPPSPSILQRVVSYANPELVGTILAIFAAKVAIAFALAMACYKPPREE